MTERSKNNEYVEGVPSDDPLDLAGDDPANAQADAAPDAASEGAQADDPVVATQVSAAPAVEPEAAVATANAAPAVEPEAAVAIAPISTPDTSAQADDLVVATDMPEQKVVVAVKLRYNPKAYWFDPVLSSYQTGDHVLVDTERGREIGLVVDGALNITDKQFKELNGPLKPVIRVLSAADYDRIDELDEKGRAAMPYFRELIEKHGLDMKPVSVDYLFTGDKAVFYFSNDDRVDFRDLVRDLASHFHIRVDMRQIGVRDEARILGGLAHCGEELCCTRLGGEFQPVSIRMAKEQDLPLNPVKISGACGRLMCCLRYEFEAYKDFKTRAPKKGALIETPIGQAKVIDLDTPREVVTLRLEDGKQLAVPLKEFECEKDDSGKAHPCRISRDTIDHCASASILMALAALEQENAPESKPALKGKAAPASAEEPSGRRLRRGKRGGAERGSEAADAAGSAGASSRGSSRGGRGGREAKEARVEAGDGSGAQDKKRAPITGRKRGGQKVKQRPGQHSSGLRLGPRSDGTSRGDDKARGDNAGRNDDQARGDNASRSATAVHGDKAPRSNDTPASDRNPRSRRGRNSQSARSSGQKGVAPSTTGASPGEGLGLRRRRRPPNRPKTGE